MIWAGNAACMGKIRNSYEILIGKHESKRLLGRPRGGWEDNIKIDIKWKIMDWIHVAQAGN
jgi:hypothetical protein